MNPTRPILSFIDVETGGLDETRHGLLEVAIVQVDRDLDLLSSFETRIRILPGRTIEEEARALHPDLDGLTGVDPLEAYEAVRAKLSGTMAAGWNVGFDLRFLEQARRDTSGQPIEWAGHHVLDVAALVIPAWLGGEIESCSLGKVAAAYGLKVWAPAHRALSDCLTTIEAYRFIRRRYRSVLRGY